MTAGTTSSTGRVSRPTSKGPTPSRVTRIIRRPRDFKDDPVARDCDRARVADRGLSDLEVAEPTVGLAVREQVVVAVVGVRLVDVDADAHHLVTGDTRWKRPHDSDGEAGRRPT